MSNPYLSTVEQSLQAPHVRISALASIIRDLTQRDRFTLQDMTDLHHHADAADLNDHEYAAVNVLRSKLATEGTMFLESLRSFGW